MTGCLIGEQRQADARRSRTCCRSCLSAIGVLAVAAAAAAAPGAENAKAPAKELITPAVERSIDSGLKWLVAQQRADGSFGAGANRGNVGVTALAGMAWMANGSTPGRGAYGEAVNRCLNHLLGNVRPSGFIFAQDASHGPMYGHGFATMFLAECYGAARRPELRDKLSKAVRLIVDCQNEEGGWRYQPVRADADISVTACQIVALRAARNAGIFVPSATIDRAIGYVKRCQNGDGGFRYMLPPGKSAFPRSAAAVVAFYGGGAHESPELGKALPYLMQFLPGTPIKERQSYYFYGQYYAAQAMWQVGGESWRRWYPAMRDALIARQRPDGSWQAIEGDECGTAMACFALQVPNDVLPILQR